LWVPQNETNFFTSATDRFKRWALLLAVRSMAGLLFKTDVKEGEGEV
jgi:hypothetical protein